MSDQSKTIPQLLAATIAARSQENAFAEIIDEQLAWRTWGEVHADVQQLAQAMLASGIQLGDRVIQVAANSYEWIVTDLAIHEIGAVHVPLHVSLAEAQIVNQIADCGAKIAFFSAPIFEKIADKIDAKLQTVFYGNPANADEARENPVISSLEDFLSKVTETIEHPSPKTDDLATLLYTSGTTGSPRGVMLSHSNIVTNTLATSKAVEGNVNDRRLNFLPLSHIYARTCDLYSWLHNGAELVMAESRDTVLRDCQIAKPNIINGVPYFYQKIARLENLSEALGGNIKYCFCGGAALAPEIEKLLSEHGLQILPGYGLTETSPVVSVSTFENYVPGTVGQPIEDVEVRIDASGEILVRGPNIMMGYWQNEEATDEIIDDGWLHTGDNGEYHESGNLKILGRRKEIIVLMTGKNVSPTSIEQTLAGSSAIESACVVGDDRKCLGALIVPNLGALHHLASQANVEINSNQPLEQQPAVRDLIRQEMDRALVDVSHEEHVGLFVIIEEPFSIEKGEMTAKLSLRRKVIEANYADVIEGMYGNM